MRDEVQKGTRTLDTFRQDVGQYLAQQQQIQDLSATVNCGIVCIDLQVGLQPVKRKIKVLAVGRHNEDLCPQQQSRPASSEVLHMRCYTHDVHVICRLCKGITCPPSWQDAPESKTCRM